MKLLVFASTPPPAHGQSLAVQAMLELLRSDPDFDIVHLNPRLSRDHTDIGRWRPGKLLAVLGACIRFWLATLRHGRCHLYYVPAPAKRAALYRDWLVMLLCRPFARGLVLHWHACGLGAWLCTRATGPERWLSQRLLGRATLALVLDDAVRPDATILSPHRIALVPGGIEDPAPGFVRRPRAAITASAPLEILFLSLASREKGLFDTMDAVAFAQRSRLPCRLTVAGAFASQADEAEFRQRAAQLGPDSVRYLGFVEAAQKSALLAAADLLCFPTYYPHENQPTVLLEALAFDLPVVTTSWRAIPGLVPAAAPVVFVEPRSPAQILASLLLLSVAQPDGRLRAHFLAHFTRERHAAALKSALLSVPA